MNEEDHWNTMAGRYEDEIFDVFRSDKYKKLPGYFHKHAHPDRDAIDFGCGVGKAFSYLSPLFRSVLGTDISAECIALARKKSFPNITFKRADLTSRRLNLGQADFGFCCNVVMLPEIEKNIAMFRNIHRSLRIGGTALIVVPSFESILYSSSRLFEWYRNDRVKASDVPISELGYYRENKRDVVQGIITIDGVPTKHYLENEIRVLMNTVNLAITAIDKIEYDWNTEFAEPPNWMGPPYPWDWIVEVLKC